MINLGFNYAYSMEDFRLAPKSVQKVYNRVLTAFWERNTAASAAKK